MDCTGYIAGTRSIASCVRDFSCGHYIMILTENCHASQKEKPPSHMFVMAFWEGMYVQVFWWRMQFGCVVSDRDSLVRPPGHSIVLER